MSRYTLIVIFIIFCTTLSACGTTSKVDNFLEKANEEIAQHNKLIQQSTGTTTNEIETPSGDKFLDTITNNETTSTAKRSDRGEYKEYSQIDIDKAKNSGNSIILVGYRKDCGTCKALDSSISNKLSRIPSKVSILRVDRDLHLELFSRYKIQDNNTVIIIAPDGKQKQRINGGIYKIDEVLSYL